MRNKYCWVTLLLSFVFLSCSFTLQGYSGNKDLSPYDFGLASAKTGVDRYRILLETHNAAIAAGVNVDYSGIDTICLEIPEKMSRIPLTQYNDFKGCVFVIRNTTRNCWLFGIEEKEIPIHIDKRMVDLGNFRSVDYLKNGRYLLIIEDENPWVLNRVGHSYGHQRKDILLIENGMAKNRVTMPYNNKYSKPNCSFVKLNEFPLIIKNITIDRTPDCTNLTHIAFISGFDNVQITNVNINTPPSTLTDDRGIRIYNCTNINLENVCINGTYSQPNHSGYGINLGNVWNFKAVNLYGRGNWGIFGNNNVNTVLIENSKINRFDIHCYGRDIRFKNVDFFDLYNQFASVFGTIQYDKCTFSDFVPLLNGGSYNCYVAHDVVMNDCVFNATQSKNCIFRMSNIDNTSNSRYELSEKCLPNVKIKNLTVNMKDGAKELLLFRAKGNIKKVSAIGYISRIEIDGLNIVSDDVPVKRFLLSNIEIDTSNPIYCKLQNVQVLQPVSKVKSIIAKGNAVQLKTNIKLKGGKVEMRNVKGIE